MTDQSERVGEPCWIDLATSDSAASRAFYQAVVGWEAGEADESMGSYFMFFHDGKTVAGGMPNWSGGAQPDGWMTYVAVHDAAATLAAGESRGATVVVPATAVADLGTMGVMVDPTGAAIGVWQPGTFAGFERRDEAGHAIWFELHTTAYDAAREFYGGVFGWEFETVGDGDEFRYCTAMRDGAAFLGLYDAATNPGDPAPSWLVYLGVSDVDAAVATAAASGGEVTRVAEDTPYGRMATLRDPTGATVVVMAR